jgi:hypothetical protein
MPARPILLTPEVIADAQKYLPLCLYVDTVFDYLGVARATWRLWLKQGREEERRLSKSPRAKPNPNAALYLEFLTAMKRAMAESQMRALGAIIKAAPKNWTAGAWLLERRWPSKWGSDRKEIRECLRMLQEMEKKMEGTK